MKQASAGTQTLLSGGAYLKYDLYDIVLLSGLAYHFTGGDYPVSAAVYPSGTVNSYLTGLTITRDSYTQQVGLESQTLELTLSAQSDNPAGIVTIAGYSLPVAARLGLLDNAKVSYSKLFMPVPTGPGNPNAAAYSAVSAFVGNIAAIDPIGRMEVVLKVADGLQYLGSNVQMPRNLFQSGCSHTVYDNGCALSKAALTVTGTVVGTPSNTYQFNTSLTQADDYFDLGVIKFTSGANSGFQATVKIHKNASGNVQTCLPFPNAIASGDAFSIYPGCDHQQATCSAKFSNLIHFKGTPYVPVSETLYDGGTSNPPNPQPIAAQIGNTSRSGPSGRVQG